MMAMGLALEGMVKDSSSTCKLGAAVSMHRQLAQTWCHYHTTCKNTVAYILQAICASNHVILRHFITP
jgi:hypothetical protein